MAKDNKVQKVDVSQAFFDVPLHKLQPYMSTVLLAFVQGIPTEWHQFCLSQKNPGKNPGSISSPEQRLPLLAAIREHESTRQLGLHRDEGLLRVRLRLVERPLKIQDELATGCNPLRMVRYCAGS